MTREKLRITLLTHRITKLTHKVAKSYVLLHMFEGGFFKSGNLGL